MSGKQQHYGDKQEEENEQFWKLASEIHWFLFSLFVLGHIEDQSTGFAFRFPGGLNWSIFVEVCQSYVVHQFNFVYIGSSMA